MKFKLSRAAASIDKYGLWKGLGLYLQLKQGRVERMMIPGFSHSFSLRKATSDTAIFEQVFLQGGYDMEFSFTPDVIIDAGAHIGLFSVVMKNRFPTAKIFCVEPDKDNCAMLRKNLTHYNNIEIVNAGLWSSDSMLNVEDKYRQGHSALVVEEDAAKGDIPALTMDSLMKNYGISRVDILKIDIEGSEEMLFLKNYEQWLPKVRMIIIELHDWLKPGCSRPFFEAVQKTFTHYSYSVCGENTIIENGNLKY
jgi:FkbM family methyltransferase